MMKSTLKILLPCLAALLGSHSAAAQPEQAFAFIQNHTGRAALKPTSTYKYDLARTVFDDLLRARGDLRQQAPAFVMNDGERYVAWMDPKSVRIGLEEKAYDVCARFGSDSLNALAALLAHELIHYYEKHDWSRNFVHAHKDMDAARHIHAQDEGVKQEAQADYLGGFLAFSAGYNVYGLMPRLLDSLYAAYALPPVVPGYPGLAERQQISQSAMGELRRLQTVFEVAQFLSVLENHEEAAQYYRHILQSFQSREIYNNAGINFALAALPLFSLTEMPYVLPLELDPHSRLHNLKSIQAEQRRLRQSLLQQALEHFDRALTLDPAYTLGYLNKAGVLTLTGEWEEAAFWLHKGRRTAEAALETDFILLEGILAALQQDSVSAQARLAAASAQGNPLAAINLDILAGQTRLRPQVAPAEPSREIIEGLRLDDFLRDPQVEEEIAIGTTIICGRQPASSANTWVHYANKGRQYTVVQWCSDGCSALSQSGIGRGAEAAALEAAYGPPPRLVARADGVMWIYPGYQLLFLLDRQGMVAGWGAYRQAK
jgi:tetratricopeptide (TPR) repeat protein